MARAYSALAAAVLLEDWGQRLWHVHRQFRMNSIDQGTKWPVRNPAVFEILYTLQCIWILYVYLCKSQCVVLHVFPSHCNVIYQ